MGVKELFTNRASTTLLSGGSDAPAAGTGQSWTVVDSSAFPAASSTAGTSFHVVDPAQPGEIIKGTNVAGGTWTVIRGADDTTPVVHAAGFTAVHIVVAAWLQNAEQSYSVLTYGAKGDGVADDAPAIQAAIDDANNAGGGVVRLPVGTYKVSAQLTLTSNVTLAGYGPESVIIGDPAVGAFYHMVRIVESDVRVQDLKISGGGHTDITPLTFGDGATGVSRVSLDRLTMTLATHNLIRGLGGVFNDIRIRNCHFVDSVRGVVFEPTTGGGSEGWLISGNTFRNIGSTLGGGVALQLFGLAFTDDTFKRVNIIGNVFESLNAECAPIEPTGCTDIVIAGNTIGPVGKRGITTTCKGMTISGNRITGQTIYAIELNGSSRVSITGNSIHQCDSFVLATNDPALGATDVVISGNTVTEAGYATGGVAQYQIYVRFLAQRWSIIGNRFYNVKGDGTNAVIRLGASDATNDCLVANNSYLAAASDACVQFVNINSGTRHRVAGNDVTITRAVNAAAGDAQAAIRYSSAATNIAIEDNHLRMTGSLTAATYEGISNAGSGAFSATGWGIRNNFVDGFNRGIVCQNTHVDAVVIRNDTFGCVSADTISPVYRRTRRETEANAAPTTGTWGVGDVAWRLTPATGAPIGWMCTVAGTPGTWKAMPNLL